MSWLDDLAKMSLRAAKIPAADSKVDQGVTQGAIQTQVLLSSFKDGDQHGWDTEFTWLWTYQTQMMADLVSSIARDGIEEPVLLSFEEMRVWDGHHRIAAAVALHLPTIPYIPA